MVIRKIVGWSAAGVLGLILLVVLIMGLSAAVKVYKRSEARADARNQVELTRIRVDDARQQALITQAQIEATRANADKRYQEAVGIRRAQDEISRSLTSAYLQYEAIQAQKEIATSGSNNTLIYVPAGRNGVPLVQDPQNVNRASQARPGN